MPPTPLHAYIPAKARVIALAVDLAAAWGRSGVRVNSVSPATPTLLLRDQVDRGLRDPANLMCESALGRMLGTEEVADAIYFLASDEPSVVIGVILPVDAGWLVAASSCRTYSGVPDKR